MISPTKNRKKETGSFKFAQNTAWNLVPAGSSAPRWHPAGFRISDLSNSDHCTQQYSGSNRCSSGHLVDVAVPALPSRRGSVQEAECPYRCHEIIDQNDSWTTRWEHLKKLSGYGCISWVEDSAGNLWGRGQRTGETQTACTQSIMYKVLCIAQIWISGAQNNPWLTKIWDKDIWLVKSQK